MAPRVLKIKGYSGNGLQMPSTLAADVLPAISPYPPLIFGAPDKLSNVYFFEHTFFFPSLS